MTKIQVLEIFSMVLSAGKSQKYSISFDYDTEFNEPNVFLYCCEDSESIDVVDYAISSQLSLDELFDKLREWTAVIAKDRKLQERKKK